MSRANENCNPGGDLSLPQLSYATKTTLRRVMDDGSFMAGLNLVEADALVQDATEVASLVLSFRNTLAPINRMPLEIFSLIPHYWERGGYWDRYEARRDVISMTQVCRRWREILTLRCPSLWTRLDIQDPNKTHVHIERSQSLPLKITLFKSRTSTYCRDSLLKAVTHLNRLGSLTIEAPPQALPEIFAYFSSPTPILKKLTVVVDEEYYYDSAPEGFIIPETLFPEHPQLRKLILSGVIRDLPCRNLSHLTVFELRNHEETVDPLFVIRILGFLAGSPLLRRIVLHLEVPVSFNNHSHRAVSLPNLKELVIKCMPTNSTFLNHLSIPTGASLDVTLWDPPRITFEHTVCLRRIFDHFQNTATVNLCCMDGGVCGAMRFDGPNGEVWVRKEWKPTPLFPLILRNLSETQKLSVTCYVSPHLSSGESIEGSVIFQTLHTCNPRTLILVDCENQPFIHALNPGRNQRILCPELEELCLDISTSWKCRLEDLVEMASERAKRALQPLSIKINGGKGDFSILREYFSHVELGKGMYFRPYWAGVGTYEMDWFGHIWGGIYN